MKLNLKKLGIGLEIAFVASAVAIVLTACGGGGGSAAGNGGTPAAPGYFISATFNPPVGTPLLTTGTLSVTFDRAMNSASAVMAPAGGTWNAAKTTYTLPTLAAGALNASVSAVDATNTLAVNLSNVGFAVYNPATSPFVYVSPAGNDTTGIGAISAPFATITQAAASAVAGQAVLVAGGTYTVNSGAAIPTNVVVKDGVSLYGGYAADFSSRDPAVHVTTITDVATAPAATLLKTDFGTNAFTCGLAVAGAPRAAVVAGNLTSTVVIDGFTINGSATAATVDSAAVSINSVGVGALVLTNNTLNGGAGSAHSVGVYDASGTYTLALDTVNGGGSAGLSMGVYTGNGAVNVLYSTINGGAGATNVAVFNDDMGNVNADLRNSVIAGGGGANSYGVYSVPNCPAGTGPVLINNSISGGSGTVSSTGVYAAGWVYQDIFNSTIDGGNGPVSTGINVADQWRTTNVWNSTVSGGSGTTSSTAISTSAGINGDSVQTLDSILFVSSGAGTRICFNHVNGVAADIFSNNDVSPSCTTALYSYNGTGVTTLAASAVIGGVTTTLAAKGNVTADPKFVSASDWHLTAASPAEVLQGGLNNIGVLGQNVNEPGLDMDGLIRTPVLTLSPANASAVGVSMGAYEKN